MRSRRRAEWQNWNASCSRDGPCQSIARLPRLLPAAHCNGCGHLACRPLTNASRPDSSGAPGSGVRRGASHWRSRPKRHPLQADQATRQGSIACCAFLALGKDSAIEFLNTHHDQLGGRPIAIATASAAGELLVACEIGRMAGVRHVTTAIQGTSSS